MRIDNEIGFIHVPKTGGQSIEHLLLDRLAIDRRRALLVKNADPAFGPPRLAHLTMAEYGRIYQYRPARWFALIRNPIARFLSEMSFRGLDAGQSEIYLNRIQFGDLADDYHTGEDYLRHAQRQVDFFQPGSEVWLMQFEVFMQNPLRHLTEIVGRDLGTNFPHIIPKATKSGIGRARVNRTTERKLEDFYAKDAELWSRCGQDLWAKETLPIKRRHISS